MTHTYALWLLISISVLATAAYTAGWLMTDPPTTPPKPDNPNQLIYCSGCGCRHKQLWMTWDDTHYRCIICCGDTDKNILSI